MTKTKIEEIKKAEKRGYSKGYYAGKKSVRLSPEWVDHQMKKLHESHYHLIDKPKFIQQVVAQDPKEPNISYVLRILDVQVTNDGARVIVEREKVTPNTKLQQEKEQYLELVRAVEALLNECPYVIEEATVPKAGVDVAPQQVVGTLHMSLARRRKLKGLVEQLKAKKGQSGE